MHLSFLFRTNVRVKALSGALEPDECRVDSLRPAAGAMLKFVGT
jgi:hypothetical protein